MVSQAVYAALLGFCFSVSNCETIMAGVEIGEVVSRGRGCPAGTVTTTTSPDSSKVAVLFGKFAAVTNEETPVAFADCKLEIPLKVKPGFSVGGIDIDWRGSAARSERSYVDFHRKIVVSQSQGGVHDSRWTTKGFENFLLTDEPQFVLNTGCKGVELVVRVDLSSTVVGTNSIFTLRSGDVSIPVQSC